MPLALLMTSAIVAVRTIMEAGASILRASVTSGAGAVVAFVGVFGATVTCGAVVAFVGAFGATVTCGAASAAGIGAVMVVIGKVLTLVVALVGRARGAIVLSTFCCIAQAYGANKSFTGNFKI